ncbi:hypothetical protein LCGC14_0194370 [marine sediment metagenome]|uniref:Uncharacterized protein n=1 Tax=marine sediment metagenome TaxID=412755 RepID=A0A0F9UK24_9ZZZZ|nr:hypothetical protein [bacterium]
MKKKKIWGINDHVLETTIIQNCLRIAFARNKKIEEEWINAHVDFLKNPLTKMILEDIRNMKNEVLLGMGNI